MQYKLCYVLNQPLLISVLTLQNKAYIKKNNVSHLCLHAVKSEQWQCTVYIIVMNYYSLLWIHIAG